jgi:hypothetical protein
MSLAAAGDGQLMAGDKQVPGGDQVEQHKNGKQRSAHRDANLAGDKELAFVDYVDESPGGYGE